MLYVDSKIKLVDHILTKVDLMSMKTSLEVRTPFLDHRVVKLAFSLPGRVEVETGLERNTSCGKPSGKYSPGPVYNLAPKRGFEIPVSHWLKNELAGDLPRYRQGPGRGGGY